jgi:hypothetical protein
MVWGEKMNAYAYKIRMPAAYVELSAEEMEYDGNGFWNNLWNSITKFAGDLAGGITGFFGFGNNDQFNQQRNGWGPQSFYNTLDQLSVGISRYLSSPMRYN